MKKLRIGIIMVVIIMLLTACNSDQSTPGSASSTKTRTKLTMGTGGTGGAKSVYMGALAKIVSDNCENIELISQSSGGSGADLELMKQNQIQLSLIEAGPAHELYIEEGADAFTNLRSVFGSYPSQFVIVTTDTNITDITQLSGKVVSPGPTGGGTDVSARQVLPILGVEPKEIINIQWNDAWTALAEGRIDAVVGSCGNPASAILEGQTKATFNWVRLTDEQKQTVMDLHPYYVDVIIPNSYYDNMGGDYETIGSWMSIYVLEEVEEDVVYDVTKAIMENLDILVSSTGRNAESTQLDSILYQSIPIHKGALKYYEEQGLEIPDNLILE